MAETGPNKTLRDLLEVCFRYKWVFAVSAALFAVAVFVAAQFMPVEYSATTKFERRLGEALSEQGLSGVAGTDSFEASKQTQIEDLVSSELLESVAAELGVLSEFTDLPQGIAGGYDLSGTALRNPRDGERYLNTADGIFVQDAKEPQTQELKKDWVYRWNGTTKLWDAVCERAAWRSSFKATSDIGTRDGREPAAPDDQQYYMPEAKGTSKLTGQTFKADWVYQWVAPPPSPVTATMPSTATNAAATTMPAATSRPAGAASGARSAITIIGGGWSPGSTTRPTRFAGSWSSAGTSSHRRSTWSA